MIAAFLVSALFLPLLGGALCALPVRGDRLIALATAGAALAVALGLVALATPEPVRLAVGSAPAGLAAVLHFDRGAALLLVLVAVVTLAATVQAPREAGAPVLLAAGGLVGAILAADLFTQLLFLQLSAAAIASSIGAVRPEAAMRYLVMQIASGLLFVFGTALFYSEAGTLGIETLRMTFSAMPDGDASLLRLGGALIATGLAARAGFAPVHLWLPASAVGGPAGAMTAMTAGVNAAILLRLMPLFDTPPLTGIVPWLAPLGLVTAVCGLAGVAFARDAGRQAGYAILAVTGLAFAMIDGPAAQGILLIGIPAVVVLFLVIRASGIGRLLSTGVAGIALLGLQVAAAIVMGGIGGGVLIGGALAAGVGLIRTARTENRAGGRALGAAGLAVALVILAALSGAIGRYVAISTSPAQTEER